MTKEHALALVPLLTAYGEGKTIQARPHLEDDAWTDSKWEDLQNPDFAGAGLAQYRIKPEPKPQYRPYTQKEALVHLGGNFLIHKHSAACATITCFNKTCVWLDNEEWSYEALLSDWTRSDKTPLGVELDPVE